MDGKGRSKEICVYLGFSGFTINKNNSHSIDY